MDIAVIAATFGLIFVSELPDKTAIAGLVLGTRYPWRWAFAGMAAAFATHVAIAVAAGSLIALAPQRWVTALVAVLFLLGAVLIWREGNDSEPRPAPEAGAELSSTESGDAATEADSGRTPEPAGFWRVATLGYGVIFLAEWGDLTQIMTANLAARYDDPLSVALGAVLGLWAVALLAILGGRTLLRVLPIRWITRLAATVMLALAVFSAVEAIRG